MSVVTPRKQNVRGGEAGEPSPLAKKQKSARSSSSLSPPPPSQTDRALKTPKTPTPSKARAASSSPTKRATPGNKAKDGWTADRRLKLFEAYTSCADIKWDEIAAKVGDGATAKSCREQWQRATGARIRRALQED